MIVILRRLAPLLLFFILPSVRPASAAAPLPVAITYELAGEARHGGPGRPLQLMHLYDRLPAGTSIELAAGSRLALAFVSGKRYEISGPARATLGREDFVARSGGVRALPSVPPLPRLAPIAKEENPGAGAGAIRIRGEEIDGLRPRGGAMILAGATVLRFRAASGAAHHRVEIENGRGTVIFRSTTEGSAVEVPAGILEPGARYHWTVTALDQPGPARRGEADFATLSRKTAEAREKWREAVEAMGDGGSEALLAAVDHGLGLTSEAGEKPQASAGAIVESVTADLPGDKAGLQPGDLLLSWSCLASPPALPQAAGGGVSSPYDLVPLEVEEAPRRHVSLRGRRGNESRTWVITAGEWGIETRPALAEGLAALYLEGKAKNEAGDLAAAELSWRSAVETARSTGDARLAAWLLHRLARTLAKAGKWPEADTAYEEALALLEQETQDRAAAHLLRGWADTFTRRGAWDGAVERFHKALALDRTAAPEGLAVARTLNNLGVTMAKSGDYPAAAGLLRRALAIREELAPNTVEVTGSLNNLGTLARRRGDLAAAEAYLARGEEVQRRIGPDSADHALFFQNRGNIAMDRGDLEKAEAFHRRALAIYEKVDPEGRGMMDTLSNLSNVALVRGDLATTEALMQRSLALQEKRAPDELDLSVSLINLGNLATRRGDLDGAELYLRRSLAIQERLAPEGWQAATSLLNLGNVKAMQGDPASARGYLRRSLKIKEHLAPDGLDMAEILNTLGQFEMDTGSDLATAEELLGRGLVIFEREGPESLGVAESLLRLGEIAVRRGHLTGAIAQHRRALALQSKLAPGSLGEAETLDFLGRAERLAKRATEGTQNLCLAVDVLDRQRAKMGGTANTWTSFEASLGDYYFACLEGLMDLGRPAEAFHVLERGRARSFLALLAERDIRLAGLSPDLAAERRQVNAEYDRVQASLGRLSAGRDDAEIEKLTGELRDLRARQEEIVGRSRQESPRTAALHDPEPLDLARARATLDPGTVLLEYMVGAEGTWLFVVEAADAAGDGLSVFRIAAGTEALREEVEGFRRLLKRSSSDRAALQSRGRHLYDLLVRPAEARMARAQRILISADGPLHTLPFAALKRGSHYLVEWKPLHSVLSASVYAELARSRPARETIPEMHLVAFGDPVYPAATPDSPADPELREAVRRGLSLKSLPSSRQEVEAIADLFPQAEVYLGREATEEKVKAIQPESRLVHFACHGLLDQRFPLNSALALSLPQQPGEGQDNGLLQAWEIFESVRLDADLVTLSACDTALGRDTGGEGLVGLTRAFQYAGARSVLASMWSISDASTARLMARFYGHLRSGKAKDEALRAAQIDQIREKSGSSHPFHWAAFGIFGDWR